jgi:hypothetical protein
MDDDFIPLCDACHSLTDDKITRLKLQNGYANLCRKPDSALFYGDREVIENGKIKTVKIVKADEFYLWVKKQISKKSKKSYP